MDKENKNGDGTGEAARPGAELTREQIMAQRAEAKKLKAARKNKSGAGGGGGGNAAAPSPPVAAGGGDGGADKKEKPGKEKKPQQPQQQPPPPLLQAKHNKGRAPDIPSPTKENKAPVEPQKKVEQQVNRPSKEKTPPQKGKEASPPKSGEKQAVPATPTPSAQVEKVGTDGVSKSETPERSIPGSKGASEFQSRIQSLFQVKKGEKDSGKSKNFQMHPLFHSLGVKLRHNVIRGTNHRCIALLNTLKEYVGSYQTPHGQSFKHGLSSDLRLNLDALREKCPFAIGMENAVEFLNAFLYKMEQDVRDVDQQKEEIQQVIYQYIEEKIEKAVEAIVIYGMEKITTGDVIMIYSVTEAVISLLEKAVQGEGDEKKTFELILIQTPETLVDLPALLKKLSEPIKKREIIISSVIFPNAIYRMRHCTKLIIGGHGLFTTGGVMAQSGSAELALLASTYNKPTIFLCETYKFCDRSPLDFFTLDEYIPEQSVTEEGLFQPKIRYDVTPANLVTVVVTDIDLLPSTSVPVVLRTRGIE